jgi:mannose-6-phosphate isomerase class I
MINQTLDNLNFRCSDQFLMPAVNTAENSDGYHIYPAHHIPGKINLGYDSLAKMIAALGTIIIDGYIGVSWQIVKTSLQQKLAGLGIQVKWLAIDNYLQSKENIEKMVTPSLGGDDPLFGKIFEGELADFFKVREASAVLPEPGFINIVYGCGAAIIGWDCPVIYFDVPKNEIQFRSRAQQVTNLGMDYPQEPKAQYKRFYFVDWVVLNKHKHKLLPKIDVMVDEQRPDEITWIQGADLKDALASVSANVFRARPWFEPGIWGGQWIKKRISGLNKDVVNYAWSFELIAPENGIVFENEGKLLEVSIDTLLYHDHEAILGKAAKRFGHKFPIRFDFLDTMGGDKLSLQCHPSVAYTRESFGEDFTQDESYYILESAPGAEVYLGFQEDINKEEFRNTLEESFKYSRPVDVKKYVQTFPAKKHDLFLIPNGTVHCSGKDNLVLEISATPYIFTFKMYDWLRPDLNGNPRTLNIERAFENLDFTRKGDVVTDSLISKKTVIKEGEDWRVVNLSTHPEHFYAVERLEFRNGINDETNDQCLVLSLVEGDSITVNTGGHQQVINYAETFIIPAAAKHYTMQNNGKSVAKVVKAFVKEICC